MSQYVSLIHRCYNFSGRNCGKFSVKKFGYEVTEDDVVAFVKKYPDGIIANYSTDPGSGIEMEEFLIEQISKCGSKNRPQNYFNAPTYTERTFESEFEEEEQGVLDSLTDKLRSSRHSFSTNNECKTENSQITEKEIVGPILLVVGLVVLALVFNWFGIRTALFGFLVEVLLYIWLFGLLIFLLMLLFNKVKVMDGKSFITKFVFYIAVAGIGTVILMYVIDLLLRFK